jgi:hypothetical protein
MFYSSEIYELVAQTCNTINTDLNHMQQSITNTKYFILVDMEIKISKPFKPSWRRQTCLLQIKGSKRQKTVFGKNSLGNQIEWCTQPSLCDRLHAVLSITGSVKSDKPAPTWWHHDGLPVVCLVWTKWWH